jgi:hypothetical protein
MENMDQHEKRRVGRYRGKNFLYTLETDQTFQYRIICLWALVPAGVRGFSCFLWAIPGDRISPTGILFVKSEAL